MQDSFPERSEIHGHLGAIEQEDMPGTIISSAGAIFFQYDTSSELDFANYQEEQDDSDSNFSGPYNDAPSANQILDAMDVECLELEVTEVAPADRLHGFFIKYSVHSRLWTYLID